MIGWLIPLAVITLLIIVLYLFERRCIYMQKLAIFLVFKSLLSDKASFMQGIADLQADDEKMNELAGYAATMLEDEDVKNALVQFLTNLMTRLSNLPTALGAIITSAIEASKPRR
jgi:hypothetical protein